MKKALIVGGILLGVGALAWYLTRQANLLKNICMSFVGYKIHKLTRDQISLEVKLSLKNQSDVAITVNGYDFNVYLNGAYVTKISSNKVQTIASNSTSVFGLVIDIEPKKNKQLANWDFLSLLLLDVNNIKVKISGSISAMVAGISAKNIPVNLEMKLKEMLPDKKNPSPPCK